MQCNQALPVPADRNKMAATSTMSKSRQPNFTAQELSVLTEMVQENIGILSSKLTNSVTNQKKELVWLKITEAVNACGIHKRTTEKVKEKWRQLKTSAKRLQSDEKKHMMKTGGGHGHKPADGITKVIQDLYQLDPSWIGLEGVESSHGSSFDLTDFITTTPTTLAAEPAQGLTAAESSSSTSLPEGAHVEQMPQSAFQNQETFLGKNSIYSLIHKL